MAKAALHLNNCLTTYTKHCHRNNTRIFTIHREHELIGAAELSREGNTWEQGQVQMRNRRAAPPQSVTELVQTALQTYQKAQDQQDQDQQAPTQNQEPTT